SAEIAVDGAVGSRQSKTRDDGTFSFTGLDAGPFRVTASSGQVGLRTNGRRGNGPASDAAAERVAAGTADPAPAPEPTLALSGVVVDETGAGVDDFTLGASSGLVSSSDSPFQDFTGTGGAFTLGGFTPGTWSLAVQPAEEERYSKSSPLRVEVPSAA